MQRFTSKSRLKIWSDNFSLLISKGENFTLIHCESSNYRGKKNTHYGELQSELIFPLYLQCDSSTYMHTRLNLFCQVGTV